jgi:dUTPase.
MKSVKQFAFTEAQVSKLMTMQDELNTYIHPEWKSQRFDWNLAIIDECMEIHGHLGWKWWKKDYKVGMTASNAAQIKLEVIDILHFILSSWIETGNGHYLLENFNSPCSSALPLEFTVSKMLDFAGQGRAVMFMECWTRLAIGTGLTEVEILETYTQKYVLNKFRQDHGYKDGSYVKEWQRCKPGLYDTEDGIKCFLEDNEVLAETVARFKLSGLDSTDETALYNSLELSYNSRLNK